jgi:hypothetical protein
VNELVFGAARAMSEDIARDPFRFDCGERVMKKSILSAMSLGAIFCAGLMLQSCADTRTETTYDSGPYAYESGHYAYESGPYAYDSGPYAYETPVETRSTTTTYTTTTDDHDSILGSTAHAAGTIIAAPFRLVGDALSIVF